MTAWQVATLLNVNGNETSVAELMGEASGDDGDGYDAKEAADEAARMREAKLEKAADGWDEGLIPDDDMMARAVALLGLGDGDGDA